MIRTQATLMEATTTAPMGPRRSVSMAAFRPHGSATWSRWVTAEVGGAPVLLAG
jgi:hypothetical protein